MFLRNDFSIFHTEHFLSSGNFGEVSIFCYETLLNFYIRLTKSLTVPYKLYEAIHSFIPSLKVLNILCENWYGFVKGIPNCYFHPETTSSFVQHVRNLVIFYETSEAFVVCIQHKPWFRTRYRKPVYQRQNA